MPRQQSNLNQLMVVKRMIEILINSHSGVSIQSIDAIKNALIDATTSFNATNEAARRAAAAKQNFRGVIHGDAEGLKCETFGEH